MGEKAHRKAAARRLSKKTQGVSKTSNRVVYQMAGDVVTYNLRQYRAVKDDGGNARKVGVWTCTINGAYTGFDLVGVPTYNEAVDLLLAIGQSNHRAYQEIPENVRKEIEEVIAEVEAERDKAIRDHAEVRLVLADVVSANERIREEIKTMVKVPPLEPDRYLWTPRGIVRVSCWRSVNDMYHRDRHGEHFEVHVSYLVQLLDSDLDYGGYEDTGEEWYHEDERPTQASVIKDVCEAFEGAK